MSKRCVHPLQSVSDIFTCFLSHLGSPSKVLQEVSVQHHLHGAWTWGIRVWYRVEKIAEVSSLQAKYFGNLLWDEQDFLWEITLPYSLEITLLTCWKQRKCLSFWAPNLLLSLNAANSGGTPLWSELGESTVVPLAAVDCKHSRALWTQFHPWYLPV